ncbi:kinase-like domain-containing protein [Mycena belliarum]|uniref:Kinase-like domain-containing protein n=1 Tax=Mycena belliarum TaxID=1033014 RepID=A0AAD6U3E8_9AGAR|nr:kinase-like domain-containing protein [Mycena belliae]
MTRPVHSDSSSMLTSPDESPYFGDEKWWVENYDFILLSGYQLRPRYNSKWVPSWTIQRNDKQEYEDGIASYISTPALDAIRLNDGAKVVLKRMPTEGQELKIALLLSSPGLRSDPRNRTIPITEVIPVVGSSWTLLVMPYCRRFDDPPFHCRAEFIEAMQQYLEGLQFMHDHNISHFDIACQNLMMDETRVVPAGSHFVRPRTHSGFLRFFRWKNRCAVGPIDHYYIDFGLSMHFPGGQDTASTVGTLRTFPTIPELSQTTPYNPFKVDIYQLGLVMQRIIESYPALQDFRQVAATMMHQDPCNRPVPAASLAQLNNIAAQMSPRILKSAMRKKNGLVDCLTRSLFGGYFPSTPFTV